jgi:hypothetical protein
VRQWRSTLLGRVAGLVVGLFPRTGSADAPRVLLVRPSHAEPPVAAALVRVRGELVADGFEVALSEAQPGISAEASMTAAEQGTSATVGLFLSSDGTSAELWVVDRLTGKTVVRRVKTTAEPSEQLSQVLAVRAVELLRASLLELVIERRPAERKGPLPVSPEVTRRASAWAARPLDIQHRTHFALEAGPAAVLNPGQVGTGLLLVGRARVAFTRSFSARVSVGGLGTRPEITAPEGSAEVEQSWALGELAVAPWPEGSWLPVFSLGAGAIHVAVEGNAAWPYRGIRSSSWFVGTDAGAGLVVSLAPRLDLALEGHVMLATPEPALHFLGHEVARIARPALVFTLTVAGWL